MNVDDDDDDDVTTNDNRANIHIYRYFDSLHGRVSSSFFYTLIRFSCHAHLLLTFLLTFFFVYRIFFVSSFLSLFLAAMIMMLITGANMTKTEGATNTTRLVLIY